MPDGLAGWFRICDMEHKTMVSDITFNRLSPNRKHVVDTLRLIDNDWTKQALNAIDEGFFEKAARIIHPHSLRLARKMLEG